MFLLDRLECLEAKAKAGAIGFQLTSCQLFSLRKTKTKAMAISFHLTGPQLFGQAKAIS
jgi:hypothetical protein